MLAIDHGAERCGLAVSDPSGTVVRPLEAVPPDPHRISEVARAERAELALVGIPTTLSGEAGEQAQAAREFADRLESELGVPVETYDERFTTSMAEATARETGSGASRDSIAACHLLESYLRSRGNAR